MQMRPTLAVIATAIAASVATLLLALAPALAQPRSSQQALRVVELPRVVVSAAREPRPQPRLVQLPRVVVVAQRDAAPAVLAGARALPQPLMNRLPE